jgi:hypothetical protein
MDGECKFTEKNTMRRALLLFPIMLMGLCIFEACCPQEEIIYNFKELKFTPLTTSLGAEEYLTFKLQLEMDERLIRIAGTSGGFSAYALSCETLMTFESWLMEVQMFATVENEDGSTQTIDMLPYVKAHISNLSGTGTVAYSWEEFIAEWSWEHGPLINFPEFFELEWIPASGEQAFKVVSILNTLQSHIATTETIRWQ